VKEGAFWIAYDGANEVIDGDELVCSMPWIKTLPPVDEMGIPLPSARTAMASGTDIGQTNFIACCPLITEACGSAKRIDTTAIAPLLIVVEFRPYARQIVEPVLLLQTRDFPCDVNASPAWTSSDARSVAE
jgi:hypothetical protein